jgi:carbon monoxide dehydrogenase subunit G
LSRFLHTLISRENLREVFKMRNVNERGYAFMQAERLLAEGGFIIVQAQGNGATPKEDTRITAAFEREQDKERITVQFSVPYNGRVEVMGRTKIMEVV